MDVVGGFLFFSIVKISMYPSMYISKICSEGKKDAAFMQKCKKILRLFPWF